MIEAAATIVQENQVLEYTGCGCRRSTSARLLIAPFIVVIGLAECIEICAIAKEVGAVISHIFLETVALFTSTQPNDRGWNGAERLDIVG